MQENRLMNTVLVSEWNGNSPTIQGLSLLFLPKIALMILEARVSS